MNGVAFMPAIIPAWARYGLRCRFDIIERHEPERSPEDTFLARVEWAFDARDAQRSEAA